MSVLPVYQDRPATIPHAGGVVYVAVHDTEYIRLRAEWKRKLSDAHPDHGGTELRFHRTRKQQEAWLADELAWYARHGLTPPAVTSRAADAVAPLLELARGRTCGRALRLVRAYLAEHPDATNREVGAAVGLSRHYVNTIRHRMRRSYWLSRSTTPQRLIAFLSDGHPRTLTECLGALQTNKGTFHTTVGRLRRLGFDIVRIARMDRQFAYQLLGSEGLTACRSRS